MRNSYDNFLETLLSNEELPETVSQFEVNCQSFKKNYDKLYAYLKVIHILFS
jgi:hypothetical protein